MGSNDTSASAESGVRVFLVEDNPDHSFVAVRVLQQVLGETSEVIVAENAEEALTLIDHFTEYDRPDLMLVDLRLPDNGGSKCSPQCVRMRPVRKCQRSC
jgi:CheY-like chemotaxis protein